MKVWELMAILAKAPAGAEVWGAQLPHEYRSEVSNSYLDAEGDEQFFVLEFSENADNE